MGGQRLPPCRHPLRHPGWRQRCLPRNWMPLRHAAREHDAPAWTGRAFRSRARNTANVYRVCSRWTAARDSLIHDQMPTKLRISSRHHGLQMGRSLTAVWRRSRHAHLHVLKQDMWRTAVAIYQRKEREEEKDDKKDRSLAYLPR